MNTLSVCMIVKNEEQNLATILSAAQKFADEIVVVDTGSTDKTKEIARDFTDKIFDFEWQDDFSKARNFSFSKASCDYMMWLDGDDLILQQDVKKIIAMKHKKMTADVYMLRYVAGFDENFVPTFEYYRERIIKRDKNFVWVDPVHEVIVPRGKIEYCDIKIFHNKKNQENSDRNLKIYQKMKQNHTIFSPRQKFYYARELMFNGLYDEAIKEFSQVLLDQSAWLENKIEACLNLSKCYVAKQNYDYALTTLFGSFALGTPRGEICYQIANIFLAQNRLDEAIFWYKTCLKIKPNEKSGAFVDKDCYNFLPKLQLCLCYYRKGDLKCAERFHKEAKKIYPNDSSVLHNDRFFEKMKREKENSKQPPAKQNQIKN